MGTQTSSPSFWYSLSHSLFFRDTKHISETKTLSFRDFYFSSPVYVGNNLVHSGKNVHALADIFSYKSFLSVEIVFRAAGKKATSVFPVVSHFFFSDGFYTPVRIRFICSFWSFYSLFSRKFLEKKILLDDNVFLGTRNTSLETCFFSEHLF